MKRVIFHYKILVHKFVASFAFPEFGETRINGIWKQILNYDYKN